MILNVKYFNRGDAVPGSWTAVQVAVSDFDFEEQPYDEATALDGTRIMWSRKYYVGRIVFDPGAFNDATYGPIITAMRSADFIRINDDRYSWLGNANTVDFIRVGSNRPSRSAESVLTKSLELSLISYEVQ